MKMNNEERVALALCTLMVWCGIACVVVGAMQGSSVAVTVGSLSILRFGYLAWRLFA